MTRHTLSAAIVPDQSRSPARRDSAGQGSCWISDAPTYIASRSQVQRQLKRALGIRRNLAIAWSVRLQLPSLLGQRDAARSDHEARGTPASMLASTYQRVVWYKSSALPLTDDQVVIARTQTNFPWLGSETQHLTTRQRAVEAPNCADHMNMSAGMRIPVNGVSRETDRHGSAGKPFALAGQGRGGRSLVSNLCVRLKHCDGKSVWMMEK